MQIEHIDNHGRARVSGCVAPEAAAELATVALSKAAAARLHTLLVDFRELALTRPFSTTEAYELGKHLAHAGHGLRRVALLAADACIEPSRFVLAVAGNRGLVAAAFPEESKALAWLRRE